MIIILSFEFGLEEVLDESDLLVLVVLVGVFVGESVATLSVFSAVAIGKGGVVLELGGLAVMGFWFGGFLVGDPGEVQVQLLVAELLELLLVVSHVEVKVLLLWSGLNTL